MDMCFQPGVYTQPFFVEMDVLSTLEKVKKSINSFLLWLIQTIPDAVA
jgi:hypothetical protein